MIPVGTDKRNTIQRIRGMFHLSFLMELSTSVLYIDCIEKSDNVLRLIIRLFIFS